MLILLTAAISDIHKPEIVVEGFATENLYVPIASESYIVQQTESATHVQRVTVAEKIHILAKTAAHEKQTWSSQLWQL